MNEITLTEKVNKTEDEKSLESNEFIYFDEMSITSTVENGTQRAIYPYKMVNIPMFIYDFLKTYLYGIHSGVLANDRIKIISFIGIASATNPIAAAPQIGGFTDEGLAIVDNKFVISDMLFDGARYQVTVFYSVTDAGPGFTVRYFISALGIDNKATKTQELIDYLQDECVSNSIYKNKIINLSFGTNSKLDIKIVDNKKFESEKIEGLYIPKANKSELMKFAKCVEMFGSFPGGLRYMLCGEPGTGKTKSVRTLMNMCFGKATIIMAEGQIRFKHIFEIAKILSPAIICFDDLDLLIGSRNRAFDRESLGDFLQQLDGFEKNDVFLLCTTNDKELIDHAASRPGRFDLVLDFGKISKNNYIDIIKANCKEERISGLFNNELLDNLKKKKVTGAFIVNLIKQLEIRYKLEPESDLNEYVDDFLKLSYNGFYKQYKEEESLAGFGFSNNGYDD